MQIDSINIQKNISLKPYNTFGIQVNAKEFVSVASIEELVAILKARKDIFLISGGSNMLLTKDLEKLVVHLNIRGKSVVRKNEDSVLIKAMAGENWHDFVLWCIQKNFGGLENLSLIPGNVGTAPIQNIGAYGVEIKDCFESLEAIEIESGKIKTFRNDACHFGYRDSIFKNELKNKFIIVSVTFKLTTSAHNINISYAPLKEKLKDVSRPTLAQVSNAVIAIRNSKLPNPEDIGNSGSFFKNPVVSKKLFESVQVKYPKMPYYKVSDELIKIPAGWLIEQCGFKGKRYGDAGIHDKQALVLVNHGNATGKEILQVAKTIQSKVNSAFNILLEMEVNVV